ncbi:hypothetical protein HGRIS_010053 [Hohenbuehelia grisea]|uniref:Uncharacterized protein n=1 Tax=Hohenbuehelia grisea TaxID=104357 RepID=A0ABR3J336_9AGAR
MRVSFAAVSFVFAAALTSAAIIPRRALNLSRIESRYFNEVEAREETPEVAPQGDVGYAAATYVVRSHPRHFPRAPQAVPVEIRSEEPEIREIREVRRSEDGDVTVTTVRYKRLHSRHFPKRGDY